MSNLYIYQWWNGKENNYILQKIKSLNLQQNYEIHTWEKNVEKTEKVADRLMPNLRHLCYEERLDKLQLSTLEQIRKRVNATKQYKCFEGKEKN